MNIEKRVLKLTAALLALTASTRTRLFTMYIQLFTVYRKTKAQMVTVSGCCEISTIAGFFSVSFAGEATEARSGKSREQKLMLTRLIAPKQTFMQRLWLNKYLKLLLCLWFKGLYGGRKEVLVHKAGSGGLSDSFRTKPGPNGE